MKLSENNFQRKGFSEPVFMASVELSESLQLARIGYVSVAPTHLSSDVATVTNTISPYEKRKRNPNTYRLYLIPLLAGIDTIHMSI